MQAKLEDTKQKLTAEISRVEATIKLAVAVDLRAQSEAQRLICQVFAVVFENTDAGRPADAFHVGASGFKKCHRHDSPNPLIMNCQYRDRSYSDPSGDV